jgi:signal transduction histidine kinase
MSIRLGVRASRAWPFLAVLFAAGVLALLGWVSLRQWEAAAEVVFTAQARDMAAMTAEKVELAVARAEAEVVARIESIVIERGVDADALQRLLDATPLVRRLYLLDRGAGPLFPPRWTPEETRVFAGLLPDIPESLWARGGRLHLQADGQAVLAAVVQPRGAAKLVLLTRDPDGLRGEILDRTLGALDGSSGVAVLDQHERLVYGQAPRDAAAPIVVVPLGEAFPSWRLALFRPEGTATGPAVRRQITIFTVSLGLLLLVVVGGLVATYRLVRRETEVAGLKAEFVANVSHDLKTPVSLIRMYGETLEMGRVPDERVRREYYRVITRESERLSRLIDNVLDFSRIESGRRRYDLAPTAVEPLVRETVEAFAYPLAQGGFAVEVTVAPDLPAVLLDADAVRQALSNLLDNAIKFSEERRAIRVAAWIEAEELVLAVADEGIGIPPEEQRRIFQKFYRVGGSDRTGRRGSGVGLALVRHVAHAHGGQVLVDSQPGRGSAFTVRVPVTGRPAGGA